MGNTKKIKDRSGVCAYCGFYYNKLTREHVIPKDFFYWCTYWENDDSDLIQQRIGNANNIIWVCENCNKHKGNAIYIPSEMGFEFMRGMAKEDRCKLATWFYDNRELLLKYIARYSWFIQQKITQIVSPSVWKYRMECFVLLYEAGFTAWF